MTGHSNHAEGPDLYEFLMAQRGMLETAVQAAGCEVTGGGAGMLAGYPAADFEYTTPEGYRVWVDIRPAREGTGPGDVPQGRS
jgi:hypothetical protein